MIFLPQIRKMKLAGRENKTAVVVGTITDDVRIQDIPKLKVKDLRSFCLRCCFCGIIESFFLPDLCSEVHRRRPPQDPEGRRPGDDL